MSDIPEKLQTPKAILTPAAGKPQTPDAAITPTAENPKVADAAITPSAGKSQTNDAAKTSAADKPTPDAASTPTGEKKQSKGAALTPKADKKPVALAVNCPTPEEVKITYGPDADKNAMTPTALTTLREICSNACLKSVKITSTARNAEDQARVMYDMIKFRGVDYANDLYGAAGDKIVKVYEESKKSKLSDDDTRQAMSDKIEEIGPSAVSHHAASGDGKLCAFDVAPSSVGKKAARERFVKESKAHANVQKFIEPPKDPAYHLEIPNL